MLNPAVHIEIARQREQDILRNAERARREERTAYRDVQASRRQRAGGLANVFLGGKRRPAQPAH